MSNQASLSDISGSGSSRTAESKEESEEYFRFPIPSAWEVRPMSKIGGVQGGSTPKTGKEEYWDGETPWLTPTEVTESRKIEISETERNITEEGYDSTSTHLMPENSLLLTTRATIGSALINKVPMCTNQGFQNIDPEDDVNTLYLYYQVRHASDYLDSLGSGSTFNEISKSMLKNVELPVPELSEQRRIASVLYNVDQAIQKTEEIIEQTQRVKKGLMQDLFTEGYFDHEELEELWIGPLKTHIPKNWEVEEMSDEVEKVTEMDHHMPDKQDEGIPFLAAGDIANGRDINFDEVERISEDEYERLSKKFDAERGDILYTRFGTIGVARKVDFDPKFVASYSVALIKPSEEINSSYLEHFMNYTLSQKEAQNRTRGSANKNLNLGEIKKLSLILPPSEEQEKIAEVLDEADQEIRKNEEQKEQLQRLKKGLMQDLLTGEVRTSEDVRVLDEVVEVEG